MQQRPDIVATPTGIVLDKGRADVWEAAHPDWDIERRVRTDGSIDLTVWPSEDSGIGNYHRHARHCATCRFYPYPSPQRQRELLAERTTA